MGKDYYKILGVEKNATKEDLKKAYKTYAKKYHPDLNKNDKDAENKFKEINEAISVLGDDEKRKIYDQYGDDAFKHGARSGQEQGGDFSGFDFGAGDINFDEVFDMFFGGNPRRRSRARGNDLRYDVELDLEDAAFGVEKTVRLRKRNNCAKCKGLGGEALEVCSTCHGSGQERIIKRTPFGSFQATGPCEKCNGSGKIVKDMCKVCEGNGYVVGEKTLNVKIPKGVEDGSRLRVVGEGDVGSRGQQPGDLYLFISIRDHEFFEREGNDINMEVPISFTQAVFGDDIEVPTLKGKAKLKIPAGTQSGTLLKMRGKGIPYADGLGTGDQNVTVVVDVPTKLTATQKDALKQYSDSIGEQVRPQKTLFKKIFK
ncbi:MAG: molecular chaperone DnaJ [Candidatus Woesearchaeota archaeon]|jgi:molecular chaperone DnaJ